MGAKRPNSAARIRVYLPSICASVSGDEVLDDAVLAALVVEDMCWSIARDDWISREPRWWQRRKLARWEAEHEELCNQRDGIRCLARRCGVLSR